MSMSNYSFSFYRLLSEWTIWAMYTWRTSYWRKYYLY